MADEPEILKIVIDDEVSPSVAEKSDGRPPDAHPQDGRHIDLKAGANKLGQEAGRAAGKVWESDARKTVTGGVKKGVHKGATAVAAKSADLMHEHLVKAAERQARQQAANLETRIRETDWKKEASKGTAAGLRWASQRVGQLASHLTSTDQTTPTTKEDQTPPPDSKP